jgi:hypothetical protein
MHLLWIFDINDMKKQGDSPQVFSAQDNAIPNYYDNNKMHPSIFLVLWFIAHIIWTFQFQQSSEVSIQDMDMGYVLQ